MPFQKRPDARRRAFLSFISEIENGLRDAYGTRYEQGRTNQSILAKKLGVHRSVVHHRLTGRKNLTIKSIADLAWALDWGLKANFFDPEAVHEGESRELLSIASTAEAPGVGGTVVPLPVRKPRPVFTMPAAAAAGGGDVRRRGSPDATISAVPMGEPARQYAIAIQLTDRSLYPQVMRLIRHSEPALEQKLPAPDKQGLIQFVLPVDEAFIELLMEAPLEFLDGSEE